MATNNEDDSADMRRKQYNEQVIMAGSGDNQEQQIAEALQEVRHDIDKQPADSYPNYQRRTYKTNKNSTDNSATGALPANTEHSSTVELLNSDVLNKKSPAFHDDDASFIILPSGQSSIDNSSTTFQNLRRQKQQPTDAPSWKYRGDEIPAKTDSIDNEIAEYGKLNDRSDLQTHSMSTSIEQNQYRAISAAPDTIHNKNRIELSSPARGTYRPDEYVPYSTNDAILQDCPSVAYIPCLPNNICSSEQLKSMINKYLQQKNQFQVTDIKYILQLNMAIVYLRNEDEKNTLVEIIGSINIDSYSNISVSFVAEHTVVSYVVIKSKGMEVLPTTNEICQEWTNFYYGNRPVKCEDFCDAFPNIFRIVIDIFDEFMKGTLKTEFLVKNQRATVYFGADYCFFDGIPRTCNDNDLISAIQDQLFPKDIQKSSIYIQYNNVDTNAIVLICDKTNEWKSNDSINLNGKVLLMKDKLKLIYRLKTQSLHGNISIQTVQNCKNLAGSIERVVKCGNNMIIELSNKSVYDNCLRQRILNIDNHYTRVEPYLLPKEYDKWELDSYTWYETDMPTYQSDIMQFISQPNHPIFQFKWNSYAFSEQFNRWTSNMSKPTGSQGDEWETQSNEQRHLLRMTVMLNTIGVLKKGFYCVANKKVTLKPNQLVTTVYNHQSKLQKGMTVPLSAIINYPYQSTSVSVVNEDCLIVYEKLVSKGYRPLLLNMANTVTPGGGYRKGDGAQEENLFRRSDYYRSLDIDLDDGQPTNRFYCTASGELQSLTDNDRMYPMDEFGAIYTSGLTVFRQPENLGYAYMDNPMFNVCSIAIAAYRNPKLDSNDSNRLSSRFSLATRKKIENIFAIAHHRNHDCLVLSAFGCGAFRNPPEHMATIFKSVIEQYAGFFKGIYFAIIDDHNTGQVFNPHGNYKPFFETLNNLVLKPFNQQPRTNMIIGPWQILNKTDQDEITLSDVRIYCSPLCYYGGKCRDLELREHCLEKMHPPMCPLSINGQGCKLKDDNDHALWFRHRRMKCFHDAKCKLIDDAAPQNLMKNPPVNNNDNIPMQYDTYSKHVSSKETGSLLPICPFTPFNCGQHTLLSEATNARAVPLHVQKHADEFLHICRFGRQCNDKTSVHTEKTIHIARVMCPAGEKCPNINQDDHLNLFSHPKIPDFRRLCRFAGYQCSELHKPEHISRYRHVGNYDCSTAIRYCGLNKNIDLIRNEQKLIESLSNYNRSVQSAGSSTILYYLQKCIKGFLPIYQCSKMIFELMLEHGYVMSRKYINELQQQKILTNNIRQNKQIQSIVNRYKEQSTQNHIFDYITAIHAECRKGTNETVFSSSRSTTTNAPDPDFNDAIRKEERFLKDVLSRNEIDIIRRCAMACIETSLDVENNADHSGEVSDKVFDVDNHVCTILGPQLHNDYGDIVIVLKKEVVYHPDANFSVGSNVSFINGDVFKYRPWIKDSIKRNERIKQFHESKLNCSIPNYERVAATELLAMTRIDKRITKVDAKEILKCLTMTDANNLFEAHLPDMIPLDYIAAVYIPNNIFASLTPTAQQSAKSTFGDSLKCIDNEINVSPSPSRQTYKLEMNPIAYRKYVIDRLVDIFIQNIEHPHELYGTAITLSPSNFVQHVPLPFTISQLYDRHEQNNRSSIKSDEIYIYWQAMYGDMMVTLSNKSMEADKNGQNNQYLVCYIAETPSTTSSDYKESYSYINVGNPCQQAAIMEQCSFLASSNTFHCHCNLEDRLTYCLKLEKKTGQVTLFHVGPNGIYNEQTIAYTFTKSTLDLNDLNYIYVSAGSQRVPIRNMMVYFDQVHDLHPSRDKNFQKNNASSRLQQPHIPSNKKRLQPCRCKLYSYPYPKPEFCLN